MTEPLDLEPIKARLDSAPRAPWVGEREGNTDTWRFWFGFVDGEATAELIAYAPTDIAALVAEVERLREGIGHIVAVSGSPMCVYREAERLVLGKTP